MCLTFPAHVLAIEDAAVVVDHTGRQRRVDMRLVPDVKPGEDVLVGLGQVLAHLTPQEARSMAEALASVTNPPP